MSNPRLCEHEMRGGPQGAAIYSVKSPAQTWLSHAVSSSDASRRGASLARVMVD